MRTVLTIDAKNKQEALLAIGMVYDKVKNTNYNTKVTELVQVTNEGNMRGRGDTDND